jgi:hypothetical protein
MNAKKFSSLSLTVAIIPLGAYFSTTAQQHLNFRYNGKKCTVSVQRTCRQITHPLTKLCHATPECQLYGRVRSTKNILGRKVIYKKKINKSNFNSGPLFSECKGIWGKIHQHQNWHVSSEKFAQRVRFGS